jgi:hypothetical protein
MLALLNPYRRPTPIIVPQVIDWMIDIAVDNHSIDLADIGVQTGDFLLAIVQQKQGTHSPPNISGWTRITYLPTFATGPSIAAHYRWAPSSGGFVSVADGNQESILSVFRMMGVRPATPIMTSATAEGSSSTAVCPSLTTTANDALVFRAFAGGGGNINIDAGYPADHDGFYVRAANQQAGSDGSGGVAGFAQAAASSVPAASFTLAGSMTWRTASIAVAAASPSP